MSEIVQVELGQIRSVRFGLGGRDDCMLGLSVTLGGEGWGCGDFWGTWADVIEVTENTKWSEADRDAHHSKTMRRLNKLLDEAKVKNVADLKGIPIEATFTGGTLRDWRVLTEVL